MNDTNVPDHTPSNSNPTTAEEVTFPEKKAFNRRSFLRNSVVAGAAVTAGSAILGNVPSVLAQETHGHLTRGDAAILRWLAAAEIIESDLWLQYQELAGNELTHETFINAFLVSKGVDPVSLDQFRTLPSSKATGANQIPRLTNLTRLTVDTTWWTRYRSRTGNPDLGDTFAPAVPSLIVGTHPGIPRTDADLNDPNFLQAIANTAGFHFANIEVGGASMYPGLAQRVTNVEVLRILLSIGGTEIAHFQTWHDKAGNAIPLMDVKDPVTGFSVTFPDLTQDSVGEDLKSNLIMPEPTAFLSRKLPVCSIIRPTATNGAATAALQGFANMNVFAGQSKAFFAFVTRLAQEADDAKRGTS